MSELIRLEKISKQFGPVHALKSVDLSLNSGEVLGLVGENGAGKSTLMKILGGIYPSKEFSGQIFVQGKAVQFQSAADSEKSGISFIHQELSTFSQLTVAENMMVGHWPHRLGWVDFSQMTTVASRWLSELGAEFSVHEKMASLSPGEQQLVEIAKALLRNSESQSSNQILILDEPTSSLSAREAKNLFAILAKLKAKGCGLVYISHRMEEIFSLADRVTVLRDGQAVFTAPLKDVDPKTLIHHMVGRPLDLMFPPATQDPRSRCVLELKDFRVQNKATKVSYGPINFSLAEGEILGFGGLLGSGRSEVMQALCGDEAYLSTGTVLINGHSVQLSHLADSFRSSLGLVPEDRKNQSLLPTRSLNENSGLLRLSLQKALSWVSEPAERTRTQKDLERLKTRFSSIDQKITELSGGNQQKVIFARVLQNDPHILILDEPTRGVDVGAKFEIYQLMREWTAQGKSILLVSSDLPELLAMSDRVLVMGHRKIRGELKRSEFDQERILNLALQRDALA